MTTSTVRVRKSCSSSYIVTIRSGMYVACNTLKKLRIERFKNKDGRYTVYCKLYTTSYEVFDITPEKYRELVATLIIPHDPVSLLGDRGKNKTSRNKKKVPNININRNTRR